MSVEDSTCVAGFLFEEIAELIETYVSALESRPRIRVAISSVEPPHKSRCESVLRLVAGERIEGAVSEHAAEVEQDSIEVRRDHYWSSAPS